MAKARRLIPEPKFRPIELLLETQEEFDALIEAARHTKSSRLVKNLTVSRLNPYWYALDDIEKALKEFK